MVTRGKYGRAPLKGTGIRELQDKFDSYFQVIKKTHIRTKYKDASSRYMNDCLEKCNSIKFTL